MFVHEELEGDFVQNHLHIFNTEDIIGLFIKDIK